MHPSEEGIERLICRSNRLDSHRRVINFAGGNTSAKLTFPDAVIADAVEALVVKGAGGCMRIAG